MTAETMLSLIHTYEQYVKALEAEVDRLNRLVAKQAELLEAFGATIETTGRVQ